MLWERKERDNGPACVPRSQCAGGRALERPFTEAELAARLGGACYDVYLNERAYWRCVPARVCKCTKAAPLP